MIRTVRPGKACTRATISRTLEAIPPVTSTPWEPPRASSTAGKVAGVMRSMTLPAKSSTPATSPSSSTRSGCSTGARKKKMLSVLMIVPPRTVSRATSPCTSGTRPCSSAAFSARVSMRCNTPSVHSAEADGCTLQTGTPASARVSITSRFRRLAARATAAKPSHSVALRTPAIVRWRCAATWPNEPLPCPITRRKSGRAIRAAWIARASAAVCSARKTSTPVLSVISEPPNLTKLSIDLTAPLTPVPCAAPARRRPP